MKHKYKKLLRINLFLRLVPARVLNFKRPKWQKLQKRIKQTFLKYNKKKSFLRWKSKNIRTCLLNHFKKQKKTSFWEKNRKSYNTGLQYKISFHNYFDNVFRNTYFKKLHHRLDKKNKIIYLLKPFLRLDIFLLKLELVKSCLESQYLINKGVFSINGVIVRNPKYVLRYKDVVYLDKDYLKLSALKIKAQSFPIEVDYYTNSFILSKKFTSVDLSYLLRDYFPLRQIISFFKKI